MDALAPGPVRPPRWLVRLLGARVLAQQLVVVTAPTRGLVLLGAGVDTLHALSMVAAAWRWPQQRRAASVSAASATASALLGLATAPAARGRGQAASGVTFVV
jgi:hypothetical protein